MSSIVVKDVDQINSLVWFRNDLRVDDHTGLKSAIENSNKVIGIYCFNPNLYIDCLLYTSPSPRDPWKSRMPSSA